MAHDPKDEQNVAAQKAQESKKPDVSRFPLKIVAKDAESIRFELL